MKVIKLCGGKRGKGSCGTIKESELPVCIAA
jgi:hypothetical protein